LISAEAAVEALKLLASWNASGAKIGTHAASWKPGVLKVSMHKLLV
jgi:hypothetical protein